MSKIQKPSKKNNKWIQNFINFISLLITGTGIGWSVGLSVSPVISIVITSVVGSAAAIVAALRGYFSNSLL